MTETLLFLIFRCPVHVAADHELKQISQAMAACSKFYHFSLLVHLYKSQHGNTLADSLVSEFQWKMWGWNGAFSD